MKSFLWLKETSKIAQKQEMMKFVQISKNKLNKITIITNFHAFFCFNFFLIPYRSGSMLIQIQIQSLGLKICSSTHVQVCIKKRMAASAVMIGDLHPKLDLLFDLCLDLLVVSPLLREIDPLHQPLQLHHIRMLHTTLGVAQCSMEITLCPWYRVRFLVTKPMFQTVEVYIYLLSKVYSQNE